MDKENRALIINNLLKTIGDNASGNSLHAPGGYQAPDKTEDDIIELGASFNYDGFQVVRREFFAHLREPSVTFNNCKLQVNSACLQRFPDTDYVQALVNKETKILALLPCSEGARDSFPWCKVSKGKRIPKQITCKLFFAKIVDMMGWNPDYRYKLLGRLIHANGEYLIAFDLTATEVYQRTYKEGKKPVTSRIPVFPSGWQNQFGLPYNEHKQSMQVDIFDGYAVYSIINTPPKEETVFPSLPLDKNDPIDSEDTETTKESRALAYAM